VEEFMLNALRLSEGFEMDAFCQHTGLPYARVAPRIEALCDEGLLQTDGARVSATATGYRFLNDVIARFDA
ncbi:MAG: oxygen-independent coproporphyrinogen III oxidase-like protein, partial [Gammaproteobacteria bacterium]|nr:oxygen-independent coproporphyrinogen III oxidase-like protein [Gammaproteobacteria bacterium]